MSSPIHPPGMGKRRREAAREQQGRLDEWLAKAAAPDANPAALHAEMEQWKQRDAELCRVYTPSRPTPVTSTGRVERRPRERREQRHTARSTSSGDSGDPDGEPAGEQLALTGLKYISEPLSVELERIAARLRTRGGVG